MTPPIKTHCLRGHEIAKYGRYAGGACRACKVKDPNRIRIWKYESLPHGTSGGYTNHNCRCPECRTAFSAMWMKKYYSSAERRAYSSQNSRNYKARKKGAKGSSSVVALRARAEFYGNKCYMCGGQHETWDHVIPLSKGGTNWPSNQRPACRSCNSSKGSSVFL